MAVWLSVEKDTRETFLTKVDLLGEWHEIDMMRLRIGCGYPDWNSKWSYGADVTVDTAGRTRWMMKWLACVVWAIAVSIARRGR